MYSAFGWHLKGKLMEKYGLVPATNIKEPVLFFGCYGLAQMEKMMKWSLSSKVLTWWSGSDLPWFNKYPDIVEQLRQNQNITHIATVNFIEKDLQNMGLPYKKVPLFSHPIDAFKPSILGDSIYIYKPGSPIYCGWNVVNRIKSEFPKVPIIEVTNHHVYNQDQIKEIYRQSFLGIRLTKHDGLSHSACELGLSARKIIWNGDTPNAIAWNNIEDIISSINEMLKNKYDPYKVAEKMKNYLDIGESWLEV